MPDYGHPLRFGSFITPVNARPQHPVDLAVLSEEVGLDLVTFQDHPYQAAFHDTWTLLSWVAARTTRIHVSGNVLNLPLRQPAVLARAAASLDLLSDGRFELGLGAGGFVDAIASMGGPRRTAGENVSALDEAIDVFRGIWDADERAILRLDGAFYQLEGAKRGPAPAHDIPIWVGAVKPRMQRLIGRKGDGWLPSLPYLQPGDLERGNQTIDEAAVRAGRDPREITRLLNVSPRETAADLARLALDDGASVFILASDDPRELRRFADETAVEVRERVGEAREARGAAGSAAGFGGALAYGGVRAGRPTPELGGDPVPESLAPHALVPGDRDYRRYTSSYFRGAAPALVLRPQTAGDVQEAVRYAARHRDVPLGLFSGGHGLSGRSLNDGGIVIALGALNAISVEGTRVRVGPGATWRQVAKALAPHGLALTSGDYGGVGVGGLATAGGLGWFVREHGLTIDRMRAVEVVTADGSLIRASADVEPELFWAMRGAGANFGVAVAFEFEAHPIGEHVGFAMLQFVPDDVAGFLSAWGDTVEAAHESVTGTLIAVPGAPGTPTVVQALLVVDSEDPDTIVERLQPFADLAPLADQSVQLAPYSALLDLGGSSDAQHGRGEPVSHSGLVRHLTPQVATAIANLLESGNGLFLSIRSAGGAAGRMPADATAYAWRDANFNIGAINGRSPEVERRWAELLPHFEGSYLSFETDTGPDAVARAFPPAHLERLRTLKRRWDPAGLFRDNFFIDPSIS
jgi:alkanesulfonate monooxygenase SsuD/methylene tetrahydromethanopterin reductase-like flavin-dependent oxidoreductase (luciferase family)/FAD/FMN-containing dehydrogenase